MCKATQRTGKNWLPPACCGSFTQCISFLRRRVGNVGKSDASKVEPFLKKQPNPSEKNPLCVHMAFKVKRRFYRSAPPTGCTRPTTCREDIMAEVQCHNHCKALHDDISGPERSPAVGCSVHGDHILHEAPSSAPAAVQRLHPAPYSRSYSSFIFFPLFTWISIIIRGSKPWGQL